MIIISDKKLQELKAAGKLKELPTLNEASKPKLVADDSSSHNNDNNNSLAEAIKSLPREFSKAITPLIHPPLNVWVFEVQPHENGSRTITGKGHHSPS